MFDSIVKNISKKIDKPYGYIAKLVMETMGKSTLGKKMTEKLRDQMKNDFFCKSIQIPAEISARISGYLAHP